MAVALTDSFTEVLTLTGHTDLDKSCSEVHCKSVLVCNEVDPKDPEEESIDCHGKLLAEPEIPPDAVCSKPKVCKSGTLETSV